MTRPQPRPADRELVVQTLAYAALDTLRFAVPLDLCAYLHVVDGDGPQLYLRAPDMSTMTTPQAFDVFTSLRDTVGPDDAAGDEAGGAVETVRIGRYDAIVIRSAGSRSRGAFVIGREDQPLADDERAVIEDMCAAMSLACHTLEDEPQRALAVDDVRPGERGVARELIGVSIRIDDGAAHADVIFGDGTRTHRGSGDAATTTDAVALATLAALAPDRKLGEVTEGTVSGERVMLALVRDDAGRARIGTAIVGNDPVRAAAAATADAV